MDRAIKLFPYFLLLFHAIGIGLFLYFSEAPELSYLNILLSALLVLFSEKLNIGSLLVFGIIFLFGFVIELIGVQTGYLFGTYVYEDAMGPLIYGTPIIIGATWYAVVLGSCSIARSFKANIFLQSLIAGALAVLMDLMIEQVAINYGLWAWEGGTVPVFNYVCWFIFGSLFSFIYLRSTSNLNETARYLYWIWLGFFSLLTILI